MKKLLVILSALFLVGAVAVAQDANAPRNHQGKGVKHAEHIERARAEKVGFITERLNLTPDEAQVFWPVYNEYEKEMMAAGLAVRQTRKALRPGKDEAEPSEKELRARIEDYLKALKEEAEVKAKYNSQFLKVLPALKVAKLYLAEESFQNKMLREMYNRQAERHGQKGNRPGGGQKGQRPGKDKPAEPTPVPNPEI